MTNDFLDNLANHQYIKLDKRRETIESLKKEILELQAEIAVLKAFQK